MKVVDRRFLRGPNIHSTRPVVQVLLDLEALDGVASTAVPGFNDALLAALPTLEVHRCSPGHVGGFVERLRAGTYMAHITEHLTLELQCLAGHEVGFGRARRVVGKPRHDRVVFAYVSEHVAEAALHLAIDLVTALAAGRPFALELGLTQLRQVAQAAALGPSTRAIVDAAARRGIPVLRLTEHASVFQLGWGVKQQRIQATMTSNTSHVAVGLASDKDLTKRLLAQAGLPVPQGRSVTTFEAAQAAALAVNGLVTVKPLCGNQGKGVTTSVSGADAVAAAFGRARQFGRNVLVEEQIEGDDYRVLVIGGQMVAASRRVPPEVTGDGLSNVRQLVDAVNADPRRGDGHGNVLTKIRLDDAAAEALARQQLDAHSVPAAGRVVRLRGNGNLSTGGTAQDVTRAVHPDTAFACVRAARKIGLDVAGIDLVCRDIALPLEAQGGAIIEVNAAPGIRMHEHPSSGQRRRVGRAIVDALFAPGEDGRVPVIAVTGSNGKTTTTLAIAHVLQRLGHATGAATSDGITLGGRRIQRGDCTGHGSARSLLTAPEVEFAVLETARADMLAHGLGFDRCDVAVVLNVLDVRDDHHLLDGVQTQRDLTLANGLVVATARTAVVLNADDAVCVRLAQRAPQRTEVIYFGFDAASPAMAAHLARGGRAVLADQGLLLWADGARLLPLATVAQLPSTLDGRARHNVANAMASFAALLALALPPDQIAAGLASFGANHTHTPLRLNLYDCGGVTLLVDSPHNAAACRSVIATGRQITQGRLVGVVAVPGERCEFGERGEPDLLATARLWGAGLDGLVVCTTAAVRHPPVDRQQPWLHTAPDLRAAVRLALGQAEPGDVVIIGCASRKAELHEALAGLRCVPLAPDTLVKQLDDGWAPVERARDPAPTDMSLASRLG